MIDEMIGNQKVVQAFSHEDEALEKFDEINGRLQKCSLESHFLFQYHKSVQPGLSTVWCMQALALYGAFTAIQEVFLSDSFPALLKLRKPVYKTVSMRFPVL